MTSKIVVFGATGYAGGLVVESLLRRGVRPVLAGYEQTVLPALAKRLGGLDYQFADINDPASVRALVEAGDVLVTTVGPFNRFGHTTAQAAADQGAHYIDSTGEVGFVRELQQRHTARAIETGAIMLPAFGYDYIPGILAGALASREAGPAARSIDVGHFVDGSLNGGRGLSQGTRKTVAEGITLPVTVCRNGELVDVRAASAAHTFTLHGKRRSAILASGTEILYLPAQFPNVESVSVFNGWFSDITPLAQLLSVVANTAIKHEVGERVVDSVRARLAGPVGGPDAAERSRTRTHVVAVATDAKGSVLSEVHVEGPSIYTLTGETMAWAGQQLALGNGKTPGVVGAIDAFGLDGLIAGAADIGLVPASA